MNNKNYDLQNNSLTPKKIQLSKSPQIYVNIKMLKICVLTLPSAFYLNVWLDYVGRQWKGNYRILAFDRDSFLHPPTVHPLQSLLFQFINLLFSFPLLFIHPPNIFLLCKICCLFSFSLLFLPISDHVLFFKA